MLSVIVTPGDPERVAGLLSALVPGVRVLPWNLL